jgi:predicted RNase H-like HicB family nuclease
MTDLPADRYTVRVHLEHDGTLRAEVLEIPGCVATGVTLDEVRDALERSLEEHGVEASSPLPPEAEG